MSTPNLTQSDPTAFNPQPLGSDAAPLDEQHLEVLRDAKARRKKIDRAGSVATFNGWSTGVFAVISLPFALFSVSGFLMCLGLAVVAYHEFKGRALLRSLDLRGPRVLGYNQIGFGVLIVAYCLWSMFLAVTGPDPYAQYMDADPALADMLGGLSEVYVFGSLIVYGFAIVLTVPYQTFMAWYYFGRAKHLSKYLSETPDWVAQAQRAAA
jgi:hypothetical protein